MPETPSRNASSMPTVTSSFDSSRRMLAPPETRRTTPARAEGSTDVRSTPRVSMMESASGSRGAIVRRGSSSPLVGPMK